jgi:hypothetical protein
MECGLRQCRIVDASNTSAARTKPYPASTICQNPPDAAGRDAISRREELKTPLCVAQDAGSPPSDPNLTVRVFPKSVGAMTSNGGNPSAAENR